MYSHELRADMLSFSQYALVLVSDMTCFDQSGVVINYLADKAHQYTHTHTREEEEREREREREREKERIYTKCV